MIVLKYPLGFAQWRTLVSWHKVLSSIPSPEMRRKGTTILREGSLLHSLDFEVVFHRTGSLYCERNYHISDLCGCFPTPKTKGSRKDVL